MDYLIELLNRKEVWTLIGVVVGISLTEIIRNVRQVCDNRKLKQALFDELDSNYFQLEHKKDTVKNIIGALDKKELLPATSVPFATAIFDSHLSSVIRLLRPIERDVIQNIYGRLRIIDKFLDNFEEQFNTSLKDKIVEDLWVAYKEKLKDISDSCGVAQELIRSVLEKKSVDIYSRDKKDPVQVRVFAGIVTPEITRRHRGG